MTVDVARYRDREHVLNPGYLQRTAEHANEAHEQELRTALTATLGLPLQTLLAASLVRIDPSGVDVSWLDDAGAHVQRLDFLRTASSPQELGAALPLPPTRRLLLRATPRGGWTPRCRSVGLVHERRTSPSPSPTTPSRPTPRRPAAAPARPTPTTPVARVPDELGGISDDQLPEDLQPGEDNPLAEPLDPDAEETKSREELEMDATQEDLGNDDGASSAPDQDGDAASGGGAGQSDATTTED